MCIITEVTSKESGEPAHKHSVVRVFAVHRDLEEAPGKQRKSEVHTHLKNHKLENHKVLFSYTGINMASVNKSPHNAFCFSVVHLSSYKYQI